MKKSGVVEKVKQKNQEPFVSGDRASLTLQDIIFPVLEIHGPVVEEKKVNTESGIDLHQGSVRREGLI